MPVLQSLTLNNAQADVASGAATLIVRNLSLIGANANLDMSDNDPLVDYTGAAPRATIQGWINAARTGGTWNGSGITSSRARTNSSYNTTLGVMEATEYAVVHGGTFNGQTLDTTAVLVKYTYYGDTDFNGKVNFDDYVRTDAGFNNHRTGWINGDFDGNGQVNFDDYVLIDLAFNTQGAALRRGAARGFASGSRA